MPQTLPPLPRRCALLGAAAAISTGWTARAAVPDAATLFVAGPSQGETAAWADLILPALTQALPPSTRLGSESVGGADGVTAANQFQARATPDGGTALLLPGMAALAWLVGDPRARFNAAQWITVLAGTTPAILASRLPLNRLTAGHIMRVAGDPVGPALPALLTLEMVGALPRAVPDHLGLADVDAVVLHGRDVARQAQAASQAGFMPVLAFRERGPGEPPDRDPDFPDLPPSGEWLAPKLRRPLFAALGAVIAAARLDTALVLPPLTPASKVALWRRACAQAATAPTTQSAAARLGIRAETDAAAVASTAPLAAVDATALLDLRRWLAQRFGWHPS